MLRPDLEIRPSGTDAGECTRVFFGGPVAPRLRWLIQEGDGQYAIVADARVMGLQGFRLLEDLALERPDALHLIPQGERSKSWSRLRSLIHDLVETGLSRRSRVLALGGGMVGDLAGLAAALCLRGIPVIQIPTTLVAQIDAAYGGKVAVNHPLGKNLVGTFHHPTAVVVAPSALATLPPRELRSGFGELAKYGLLAGEPLLGRIEDEADRLARGEIEALEPLIPLCVEIKARLVEADSRDQGIRALLNLGHTAGHALEAWLGYRRLRHGEAVALGLLTAARLACRPALEQRLRRLLERLGGLRKIPVPPAEEIETYLTRDKKGDAEGLHLILPQEPGDCRIEGPIEPGAVARCLVEVLEGLGG